MTGAKSLDLSTPRGQEQALVFVVAFVAGVVAAIAPAEPTGMAVWDGALKFCFAAVLVVAGSKAPRWTPMVFAVVAAGLGGLTIWAVVAWVGLLAALATAMLRRRSRLLGAFAIALAVQALLRLPPFGFFGLPSLIAGVVSVVVLVSGYRYSSRLVRTRVRWGLAGLTVALFVVGVAGSLTLLGARADVERGVAAAQRGLDAARQGDTDRVVAELATAEEALKGAEAAASGPLARGLRLLPVVAQHQRAISVATEQGAVIASEASVAMREANLDTISLNDGNVDLDALQAMAPRLRTTIAALSNGSDEIESTRSPWLIPLVGDRVDELLEEVEDLLPELELAAAAAETVPGLLGSEGPRSYLIIFGTPGEARGLGGLFGSWAVVSADAGQLSIADSGRIGLLLGLAASNPVPDGIASEWYLEMARPSRFPQNLTSSPNFATVAAVASEVLAGGFDQQIDGYIYLDTWALVDLVELAGPIDVPIQDEPLTRETAERFFFDGQYRIPEDSRTELVNGLATVADAIFDRLSRDADLPGPEELGRVLGPAARAGRLQAITFDEQENDFLRRIHLLREFGLTPGVSDAVGLVHSNSTGSKLDLYLRRELVYRVTVAADGTLVSNAEIVLTGDVPDDAPAYAVQRSRTDGINRPLVSLYSANLISSITVDGASQELLATQEYGLARYMAAPAVPPTGEQVTVEFDLTGQVDPTQPYTLEIWHQPLVTTDRVRVEYTGPDGSFVWEDDLVENVTLSSAELAE